MKKLKTILPFNYFHYYGFLVLIIILSYENPLFFILLIPFSYLIRNYKGKWKVLLVGALFYGFISLSSLPKKPPKGSIFQVINIKEYETFNRYTVKKGFNKYAFLSEEHFQIGDILELDYSYERFEDIKIPGGFNESKYYASKSIFYKLNIKSSSVVKYEFHINQIPYKLKDYFKNYPEPTKSYIYALVFSDNSFEQDFKHALASLGISHLFALSGMHINLLIMALSSLLKYFKVKKIDLIIVLFLSLFVFITGFPISLLRAFLMYLAYLLLNKEGLTRLDSLSISFIILLLVNPFYRYSYSFILSFLVTFFIIMMQPIKGLKGIISIQVMSYFSCLLVVSNLNGGIYLKGLFVGVIYTILFPYLIMPLVGLSLLNPLNPLINKLLKGFNIIILESSSSLKIKIPYVSLVVLVIYTLLFIYVLLSENTKTYLKRGLILIGLIFGIYLYPNLDLSDTIYFLDVSQGDSTFIKGSFDSCNILIDSHTGTSDFIESLGDIKIDYFFITHGDYDHSSEALKVVKNHRVQNIYSNPYDNSNYINELKPYHLKRISKETIACGNILIEILGPLKNYKNNNDNSLVLKITLANQTVLFTGDISNKVEKDLVEHYRHQLECDILHISHHGSNSSTHNDFLKYVNPKQAVISVGKHNYYGHPSNEVLIRLESRNIEILLTSTKNTIIIKRYNRIWDSI